jgi:hypothetical protein
MRKIRDKGCNVGKGIFAKNTTHLLPHTSYRTPINKPRRNRKKH